MVVPAVVVREVSEGVDGTDDNAGEDGGEDVMETTDAFEDWAAVAGEAEGD